MMKFIVIGFAIALGVFLAGLVVSLVTKVA